MRLSRGDRVSVVVEWPSFDGRLFVVPATVTSVRGGHRRGWFHFTIVVGGKITAWGDARSYRSEGDTWARGWNTRAADALRAATVML